MDLSPAFARSESTKACPVAPTPGGSNVPRANTTSTSGQGAAYAGAATTVEPAIPDITATRARNQLPAFFILIALSRISPGAGLVAPDRRQGSTHLDLVPIVRIPPKLRPTSRSGPSVLAWAH